MIWGYSMGFRHIEKVKNKSINKASKAFQKMGILKDLEQKIHDKRNDLALLKDFEKGLPGAFRYYLGKATRNFKAFKLSQKSRRKMKRYIKKLEKRNRMLEKRISKMRGKREKKQKTKIV